MKLLNLLVLAVSLLLSSFSFGVCPDRPADQSISKSERETQALIVELIAENRARAERHQILLDAHKNKMFSIICTWTDPTFQPCPEGWSLDDSKFHCEVKELQIEE